MDILFYRYGSICEPDVIAAFQKTGLTIHEERKELAKGGRPLPENLEELALRIKKQHFLFVFSINFFPLLAEVCKLCHCLYVCWTVDVPLMELFSPALESPYNRVFLFDRSQYEYFRPRNPEYIYHLPLASNPAHWHALIENTPDRELQKYDADISFIGSLYNEKNPYTKIPGLGGYTKGYLEGLMKTQSCLWGVNFLTDLIDDRCLEELSPLIPDMHTSFCENDPEAQRYLIAHAFLGSQLAETERKHYLSLVSEHFDLDLYTLSDASSLPKVHLHPNGANSRTQMPLIFHRSRINLNITMRPIATGLSQRLFDVCACGGFLLTNWQEELPELFKPGTEVEYFSSPEELLDKCDYYLSHEEERAAIAQAGYERSLAQHTCDKRIEEMIRIISATL